MTKRRMYKIAFGLFFLLISYTITTLAHNHQQQPLKGTLGEKATPTITIMASSSSSSQSSQSIQPAPGTPAQVVNVVDGDTIDVVLDGKKQRIRLLGINTPETVDPRKPVQCFGKEASNHAKEILTGKPVYLESDATQDNTDKYNRLLRYVWLDTTANFNKQMILDGYAYEYTYDIPYKYQAEFKQAQQDAENAGRGLWSASTCNGKK